MRDRKEAETLQNEMQRLSVEITMFNEYAASSFHSPPKVDERMCDFDEGANQANRVSEKADGRLAQLLVLSPQHLLDCFFHKHDTTTTDQLA